MNKSIFRLIGVIIILCALLPAKLSHHFYNKTKVFIDSAHLTTATLTSIEESDSDEGYYYSIYSYSDDNNNIHTKRTSGSSSEPGNIGDTCSLYYDPLHPGNSKFKTFWSLWLIPLLLGLSALIPVFIGTVFIVIIPLLARYLKPSSSLSAAEISSPLRKNNEKKWSIFIHLSAFAGVLGIPFGNIVGPLILWLAKRDESGILDLHGRNTLNFQMSIALYSVISGFLCLLLIGFVLLPLLFIVGIIFTCIAAVKADRGIVYSYPFTLQFLSITPVQSKGGDSDKKTVSR